jgi:uncharacterized protein (TIGR03437 family)
MEIPGGCRTQSRGLQSSCVERLRSVAFLICCCVIGVAGAPAWGATFSGQVVTTSPPSASGCTTPPSVTAFLTTQSTVYLYFVATTAATDSLTDSWVAPNGVVVSTASWNAVSGTFCFTGANLNISNLPASQLGAWKVEVFDNGTLLFSVSFNVSAPPTITNAVVSTQAPPASGCAVPPSVTSFYTSQSTVHLFFNAVATSYDVLTNDWLAPDGTSVSPGDWSAVYSCYFASLSIGALPSTQLGTWTARVFDDGVLLFSIPFTVTSGSPPVTGPTITLVANAADNIAPIAPNTWVEIKGTNLALAGDIRTWQSSDFVNNQLPKTLDGVSVTVNGTPAYVEYISPTQVNILTAPGAISGSVQVQLTNNGQSVSTTVQAQSVAPSFFTFNGTYVAAEHANGSLLGPASLFPGSTTPAVPLETVVLFANGFGATNPGVVAGTETQSGTLPSSPVVTIGGLPAQVIFAGLTVPGEYQFNVIVPAGTPNGDNILTASYGGSSTQSGVYITVASATTGGTSGIQIITGNSQSTPVNTAFPSPLVVEATNAQGPVSGARVTWAVTQGSATLSNSSTTTGSNGQASINVTAGSATGAIIITATYSSFVAQFNLTATGGATGPIGITSISNTSPMPLTPLTIATQGINTSQPVNVTFSDHANYSVTTPAVSVSANGSIMVAAPVYVSSATNQIGPGTLSVTISQGSQVSSAASINVQDVPALSTYGTTPGQISHAMLVFDAVLLGQRLNQLQAFQSLPRNTIDTTSAQNTLSTLLNAVIQERSDVDQVTQNSSTVIESGSLPDGTNVQYDQTSLDMMDRIHALFLTQTFATLSLSATGSARPADSAPVVTPFTRHGGVAPGLTPRAPTSVGNYPGVHIRKRREPEQETEARSEQPQAASEAQKLEAILQDMETVTGVKELVEGTQKNSNAQNWIQMVQANAQVVSGMVDVLHVNSLESKILGLGGALLQDVQVVGDVFAQLAAFADGEITGNQALVDVAVQAMDANQGMAIKAGVDLAIALLGGPSFSEAAQQLSTTMSFAQTLAELGAPEQESVNQLPAQLATEAQSMPNISQEFGVLNGAVDITNPNGIQAAQPAIDLYTGTDLTTLADPSGDYDLLVPLNVPGFDYSDPTLSVYDPISDETLGSETVNITTLSPTDSLTLPTISGSCNDDDANDPDEDDPDCDIVRRKPGVTSPPRHGGIHYLLGLNHDFSAPFRFTFGRM